MLAEYRVIKQKTDQRLDSGMGMDGTSYRKGNPARSLPKALQKPIKQSILFTLERNTKRTTKTKRLGKVFFTEDKRFYATTNKQTKEENRQRKQVIATKEIKVMQTIT